ncbi:hypothetical protein GGP51_002606 [Salinibacter ruber]|uniref:hypothetical protein n=1 Tax=Salinibacter ruber TaxID=146919 RepID=UPI002168CF29|nr:hypothetical protein [Salinibacter ruber]MCS3823576.1 hypothetical protein [Salinibacter ruber]MCS4182345.1 hypothetical protein [Salinibacter ruber]MCS4191114.1 hypothetical protein [Salinibacter ruber]
MTDDAFQTGPVDKIASSTAHCDIESPITLSPYVVAQHGYVVVVRALDEKDQYDEVECSDGAFRHIREGDVLVGTLGGRQALKGYSGRVPRHITPGDTLHVLNLGGLIGECTAAHPNLGPALPVEVLGAVMVKRNDQWTHARIQEDALEMRHRLATSVPLVTVSGTAMETGKTEAACRIVEGLSARGLRVGAAKLTGASLMRDVRRMQRHGATAVSTFTDAGIACTVEDAITPIAKGVIHHLNETEDLDVIVAEMGDGFVGYYGVDDLLTDMELQSFIEAHVVAATDLAGAWAAERTFRERYRTGITALTGPVTDNDVGRRYITQRLGVAAHNALRQGTALVDEVVDALPASVFPEEIEATAPAAPPSSDEKLAVAAE